VLRVPSRADLALAGFIGLVSMQSAFDGDELKSPAWAVIGLIQLTALPLAFRRVRPIATFAVTLAAAVVGFVAFNGFQILGPVIALYTVARYCDDKASAVGALAVAVTATVIPAVAVDAVSPFFTAVVALGFGAAWLFGRRGIRRVAERQAALERTERAVELERARIARELHDVISHNVSVMVVQAAAARDVFDTHPARALEALGAIESVGREALGELRMLLDVVHQGDMGGHELPRAPQPNLGRLPALVEQVRAAGVLVELDVDDEIGRLPAAVDLSAYRVVQEALTNVLKHSRASVTEIELRRTNSHLTLGVTDNGAGSGLDRGEGKGLVGMRERVELLGGEFAAGPRPAGGFAVHAAIPLPGKHP